MTETEYIIITDEVCREYTDLKDNGKLYKKCICKRCGTIFPNTLNKAKKVKSCGCLKYATHNRYEVLGQDCVGFDSNDNEFYFDINDFNKIRGYQWVIKNGEVVTYMTGLGDSKIGRHGAYISLARMVLDLPNNNITYIDCDKLNNKRTNLKIENSINETHVFDQRIIHEFDIPIDLTQKTFNYIKVIGVNDKLTKEYYRLKGRSFIVWDCECCCGNVFTNITQNITDNKNTISCGCKTSEFKNKNNEMNRYVNTYKLSDDGLYYIVTDKNNNTFMIDVKDYDKVSTKGWGVQPSKYVIAMEGTTQIRLHNFINGKPPTGFEWNHKNRDRTDNRRANFDILSSYENTRHRGSKNTKKGKIMGVRPNKNGTRWRACMEVLSRSVSFLMVDTKDEAIRQRLQAEMDLFGPTVSPQSHLFDEYGVTKVSDIEYKFGDGTLVKPLLLNHLSENYGATIIKEETCYVKS